MNEDALNGYVFFSVRASVLYFVYNAALNITVWLYKTYVRSCSRGLSTSLTSSFLEGSRRRVRANSADSRVASRITCLTENEGNGRVYKVAYTGVYKIIFFLLCFALAKGGFIVSRLVEAASIGFMTACILTCVDISKDSSTFSGTEVPVLSNSFIRANGVVETRTAKGNRNFSFVVVHVVGPSVVFRLDGLCVNGGVLAVLVVLCSAEDSSL